MTRLPAPVRADLEGLRGLAVALVVLFHARLLGVPGGFVGVDAFYVLSGFLITGLLVHELTRGRIDLVGFYARRARRILPAGTVAIVATLAAAALVIAPLDLPTAASDATASALFVSNFHFAARATDYFASTAPSPFLHFWSLAVEEQFYLVWPVLLIVAARLRRVGATIGIFFTVSLALSIILTPVNGPWSFYLLPTRGWELALGGLLALHRARIDRLPSAVVTPLGWTGLLLIGASASSLDSATAYPGLAALVPTIGVTLLIAAGARRFGPGRLLGLQPLRALGRMSYSLYLYHWPILVLAGIAWHDLPAEPRALLVALSLVVGALSWRLVEEPFRRAPRSGLAPVRSLIFASAAIVVVAGVSLGFGTSSQAALAERVVAPTTETFIDTAPYAVQPEPQSTPPLSAPSDPKPLAAPAASPVPQPAREVRPRLADARRDVDGLVERGCGLSLAGTKPPICELGAPGGRFTVALVGDSHAAQWFPGLEAIAQDRGLRLVPFTKDSCIFIDMPIVSLHLEREYRECARWRQEVVEALRRLNPDLVVVSSSRWVHPVNAIDANTERQAEAMARLLRLVPGRVVVLADTPLSAVDVPACLSKEANPEACATARDYALTRYLARDRRAAELAGADLIDVAPWMCDEVRCSAIIDSTIVYRDDHHLTATFARSLAGRLDAALAGVLPAR